MDVDIRRNETHSDPYLRVTYKKETKETEYLSNNNNPQWFPYFTYVAIEPYGDFQFEVVDSDYFGDDPIGKFSINMKTIIDKLEIAGTNNGYTITEVGDIELVSGLPDSLVKAAKENIPKYSVDFKCHEWSAEYGFDVGRKDLNVFNTLVWNAVLLSGKKGSQTADKVEPPKQKKAPMVVELTPEIKIAAGDLTVAPTSKTVEIFAKVACSTSLSEDKSKFTSRNEGVETIGRIFGSYIPAAPEGEWTDRDNDITNDRVLQRFFFYGIGAQRIHRNQDGSFYADFDAMKSYPVKPDYIPYQGKIFFSPNGEVTHITYDNKNYKPGDGEWNKAKYIVRSTALTAVTAYEHLVQAHFIWSNFTMESSTTNLNPDHPLRRLLHIHTYRAGVVNHQATILLTPKGGLLNRAFAFPYPILKNVLNDCFKGFKYHTFPEFIKSLNMEGVNGNLFPMAQDGMDYWNIVNKYVKSYINLYYNETDKLVTQDRQVVDFWNQLIDRIPNKIPALTLKTLIDYVTQFIHYVTGIHTQSGNVSAYARDPAFAGGSIVTNSLMIPPQNAFSQAVIIAVTAGDMPSMCQDFSHLMLSQEAKGICSEFHNDLLKLSQTIDERNKARPWNYNNMNPKYMATSVSV